MKVKLVDKKEKFVPFKIQLTIESEVEAREIWHRFNITDFEGSLYMGSYSSHCVDINNLHGGQAIIRSIITSQGIIP